MQASVRQAVSRALLLAFMVCFLLLGGFHDDVKIAMAADQDEMSNLDEKICSMENYRPSDDHTYNTLMESLTMAHCRKCCNKNGFSGQRLNLVDRSFVCNCFKIHPRKPGFFVGQ